LIRCRFNTPHVVAGKKPLFESAARAPRLVPDLREDYPSYFAECMVRAVELKLRRMSPSERARRAWTRTIRMAMFW